MGSTQISIYIKLHEGLYGLQFVPVLNFLKYSTISCRHVHKMYSIVQLGPSPFCQTLREKTHKALKSLLLNKWMQRRPSPNPLQLDLNPKRERRQSPNPLLLTQNKKEAKF